MEGRKIKAVDDYLENTTDAFQEILVSVREIIFDAHPELIEEYKWNMPNYSYQGLVCYMQATKKHVKLGFHKGNELEEHDNEQLLEKSTAKTMRHIKMTKLEDIKPEAFKKLIQKAADLNTK